RPDRFGADLVELAIAAFLGTLAPEHRPDVVQLHEAGLLVETVLDVGTDDGRGGLGAQRQGSPVAIFPGVHLFADDVGFFADAARKQSGLLKDRRTDLAIVVSPEHPAGGGFHAIPYRTRRRQDVARSPNCSNQEGSSL